jgi:hypothetical protein
MPQRRPRRTARRGAVAVADLVGAELGEVVTQAKPGRSSSTEITLFKLLGLATEASRNSGFFATAMLSESPLRGVTASTDVPRRVTESVMFASAMSMAFTAA